MATATIADKTVEVDDDGMLVNGADWSKEVAEAFAKDENIDLTDRHWVVIDYMRKDFAETGKSPTIRRITKNSGVETKELYQLFPRRPGRTAARLAGVPKPMGCV